eukprot:TRINITY_DN8426_c0_g1_i2.p4 TRINITY_DN8426_c0_g1~~TRINITY_DN8426_c0_g1_i2.p4  ORF type:complete len:106 (-),score=17.13 TRINITY_DN8426_c0_g1_i2:241-558(-)
MEDETLSVTCLSPSYADAACMSPTRLKQRRHSRGSTASVSSHQEVLDTLFDGDPFDSDEDENPPLALPPWLVPARSVPGAQTEDGLTDSDEESGLSDVSSSGDGD